MNNITSIHPSVANVHYGVTLTLSALELTIPQDLSNLLQNAFSDGRLLGGCGIADGLGDSLVSYGKPRSCAANPDTESPHPAFPQDLQDAFGDHHVPATLGRFTRYSETGILVPCGTSWALYGLPKQILSTSCFLD